MQNRSLMKPKPAFAKRRLIITFLLATILTVGIITGFSSGLGSDGTVYTPTGERLVMWQELPQSGAPEDYDLISNFKFAAQKLYTSSYFRGETFAQVTANVGMGIKYTQNVHNNRIVKGSVMFAEAISASAAKSIADQTYINGETVLFRPSTSIKGGSATFADYVVKMTMDDFYKSYGALPNELTKYVINETTVLSARDDNAQIAPVANGMRASANEPDGDVAALGFVVPAALVADGDGNYRVTLELEPIESSKYYRNEVRTRGGADQNPLFHAVTFSLTFDRYWNPLSVSIIENYDIAIPFMGSLNCTGVLTETFTDINKQDGEIPDNDFFLSHIDTASSGEIPSQLSPADYLATAFGPYIDGSSRLDLTANIKIDDTAINNLRLSVDIGTMNVKARLGNLYVEYADDKVYLTLNKTKGYIPVDKLAELIQDQNLTGLISGIRIPDVDAILGGDILSTVFENCEVASSNGITCVRLPFTLDGIEIDASLNIKDDDMSLQSIVGKVTAFGKTIEISAKPKSTVFPVVDETYADMSEALDFIPTALGTVMNNGAYGIKGTVTVALPSASAAGTAQSFGIDAYISRGDGFDLDGLAADAVITALGQDVSVKYKDATTYVGIGNIGIKAANADLPQLISTVAELVGADLSATDYIKMLLPRTIEDALNMVDSLEAKNGTLKIGLKFMGIPIDATLSQANGVLTGFSLDVDSEILGNKIKLAVDLDITTPAPREIKVDANKYVDVNALVPVLEPVMNIVNRKALTANISVPFGGSTYRADIAVDFSNGLGLRLSVPECDLDVIVAERTAYISWRNDVKLSCALDDIDALLETLDPVLPDDIKSMLSNVTDMTKNSDLSTTIDTALDAVKSITSEGDNIVIAVGLFGYNATIAVKNDLSAATIETAVGGSDITVTVTDIAVAADDFVVPQAPHDAGSYAAAHVLSDVAKPIIPLVNSDGLRFELDATALGADIGGTITIQRENAEADVAFAVAAKLTVKDVAVNAYVTGGMLYLSVADSINLRCRISDETEILGALAEVKAVFANDDDILSVIESVEQTIDLIYNGDIAMLLDADLALSGDDGTVTLSADLNPIGMDAKLCVTLDARSGILDGIYVDVDMLGKNIAVEFDVQTTASGALDGISLKTAGQREAAAEIDPTESQESVSTFAIKLANTSAQNITLPDFGGYVSLAELASYIEPIYDVVSKATDAKALTFNIDAFALFTADNKQTKIGGNVTISFEPLAAEIKLDLFKGTDAPSTLDIVFADGVVYVKSGQIALSFDTATDMQRLYDVIDGYDLPQYIKYEIKKLLGLEDGESAFGDLSLLVARIKQIASANSAADAIELLLSDLNTLNNKSALKSLLDAVRLTKRDDNLIVSLNAFGLTLNVTPRMIALENGATELCAISVDTNISVLKGLRLDATVDNLRFSKDPITIKSPIGASEPDTENTDDNSDGVANVDEPDGTGRETETDPVEYVSVTDFIETVDKAVKTLTTKYKVDETDEDGDITFSLDTFDFYYDIFEIETAIDNNGNTINVKDDAGRDKPLKDEAGNKIVEKRVVARKKPSAPFALAGKFVKDGEPEDGETQKYKFSLEAHLQIDIGTPSDTEENGVKSNIGMPITLDLYVVNNDSYPDGMAFIDYMELDASGNPKSGERISIDYTSIMQLVAAVMDIMGVDDDTVELLVGDYRQQIDTTVFDAMAIVGLEPIRDMLNALADAVQNAKSALADAKSAWQLIYNAGSIEGLSDRLPEIKKYLANAVQKIKTAIAAFGNGGDETDDNGEQKELPELPDPAEPTEPTEPESSETEPVMINGKLYNDIVTGVSFRKTETTLAAIIDNSLTTQTEGSAAVTVTHNAAAIECVEVDNLDVNTAKLDRFETKFTAGVEVDIDIPADYDSSTATATYSDLAQIKRLIFDVMNTANMLEFDIGGINTDDVINVKLNLNLGDIAKLDLNIHYDVKVKIIDVGKDENGKSIYKTAAVVELGYKNCNAKISGVDCTVIPDCTTRLYFYDDVLYVQGVNMQSSKVTVGTVDVRYTAKRPSGFLQYKSYSDEFTTDYVVNTSMSRVNVMYTVDEFFWMIQNDMSAFLKEFLFYLVPLSKSFTFLNVDLQQTLIDQIAPSSGETEKKENPLGTLAQIFKGYTYVGGEHTATLGLGELAGNTALSDLVISIVGKNDEDDDEGHILNNYISRLGIYTSIQNKLVEISLGATLNNVKENSEQMTISSKGLSPSDITVKSESFKHNGKSYFDYANYEQNVLYTLDGVFYTAADGTSLYTDNGVLVSVYRTEHSEPYSEDNSSCQVDKPDDKGYVFGDVSWSYNHVYTLNKDYYLDYRYDDYTYLVGTTDGARYVYRLDGDTIVPITVKSVTNDLLAQVTRGTDGKIVSVANRQGGGQWTQIWKAAYDAREISAQA